MARRQAQQPSLYAMAESARLLHWDGGVVEVRIPHTSRGTVSGYFDNPYKLARAVMMWIGRASIYLTINRLKAELLARAANRLLEFAQLATTNDEVIVRQWFPVDVDPIRPRGIPGSDDELQVALRRREDVIAYLQEAGFAEPLRIMSGNGGWALWRVDFANTEEITRLYRQALQSLSQRFSDNAVKVDESVFQPAQLIKLPRTIAVKGDPIPGRPHRRATLQPPLPYHFFEEPQLVTLEQLRWLADQAPDQGQSPTGGRQPGGIDLIQLFKTRGRYLRPLNGGKHAVVCPWREEHTT